MNVRQKIKYFIDRIFNDEIIAIKPPVEWLQAYRDVGVRVEGYAVFVTYKYKGNDKILFPIDNDHLKLISAKRAAKRAQEFYEKIVRKLENSNDKTK